MASHTSTHPLNGVPAAEEKDSHGTIRDQQA